MNKRIKCIPFPGIAHAYVVISAYKEERNGNGVAKCMSFFYGGESIGAEWEPEHGPITVLYKCPKEDKDAQPHWFYGYYTGQGNWSQLAVEHEGLPAAFIEGDYAHIFSVLKDWATCEEGEQTDD